MKKTWIATALAIAGLLGSKSIQARPAESVTVKVPFAFAAANRMLPAGTYKIEMLTKGRPGVDEVEVIALRGMDTRSYAAIVTRLGKSDAEAPIMTFAQHGSAAELAEVRVNGRSFALATGETEYAGNVPGTRFERVLEPTIVPVAATIDQK